VPGEYSYDYAIIRVVPRVERQEMINVGAILSCPDVDFLEARIEVDEIRLRALDDAIDIDAVRSHLALIPAVCKGHPDTGELAQLPQRQRFHWLVSPRSTIIQMSPVHTGRTSDPAATLEHVLDTMVRRPPPAGR
jgi:Protein of unknown function (DUF3037)